MSRSGYINDGLDSREENWAYIRHRGAVNASLKGMRGQAFLKELLIALDAMEIKELITDDLEASGQFCTLGVIGHSRGIDMSRIDPENPEKVSEAFGIAKAMVQEIVYENDESAWDVETPHHRWRRMRAWVTDQITQANRKNDDY